MVIAAGLVVLGLVGVGCGGGSDETESTATKAQFVKKAESVCVKWSKERTAAGAGFRKKMGPAVPKPDFGSAERKAKQKELEKIATQLLEESIIPSLRSQQEDLEDLAIPSGSEPKVEKMLKSLETGTDELEEEGVEGIVGNQFDNFEAESEAYGWNCQVI
jgi:hypothetical protein